MQVEAIKSGLHHGLTMVVGPPGTGKTDTAVQIIAELYHNFPEQRTLLVTHSNHALNDLFEKCMERDIPERYLMRLGRGQEDLQSDKDFSKFGRVNYMLERRLKLLEDVSELADSFDMADDVAYTCETAGHFFFSHVLSRWEKFHMEYKNACKECAGDSEDEQEKKKIAAIHREFPFNKYFTRNAEGDSVFKGESAEEDMEIAESCMKNLRQMFLTLEETRPFELLRTFKDRGNFLITKHAKVIAMTCTHAAIKRGDLVKQIGRAVQQECRDRSRMPSSA
eukprot:TRINITY_DN5083_c0_g1_i9.p1 TRINITY_DN5083_c0_g1~~TRINITY_DN5083_c0_g1_i9.p1  ORF type:complete len:280 (+),score=33.96 TRINITY_DN5083_c0_g1_i9:170-1009(+)